MRHLFKTGFGQCRCLWCGSRGQAHEEPCPVTWEARTAIAAFAAEHGRTWKSKLRAVWTCGTDGGALRQARNVVGPRGLDRITSAVLEHHRRAVAELQQRERVTGPAPAVAPADAGS